MQDGNSAGQDRPGGAPGQAWLPATAATRLCPDLTAPGCRAVSPDQRYSCGTGGAPTWPQAARTCAPAASSGGPAPRLQAVVPGQGRAEWKSAGKACTGLLLVASPEAARQGRQQPEPKARFGDDQARPPARLAARLLPANGSACR